MAWWAFQTVFYRITLKIKSHFFTWFTYQNNNWIKQWNDGTIVPSSHCIMLKIVGFIVIKLEFKSNKVNKVNKDLHIFQCGIVEWSNTEILNMRPKTRKFFPLCQRDDHRVSSYIEEFWWGLWYYSEISDSTGSLF